MDCIISLRIYNHFKMLPVLFILKSSESVHYSLTQARAPPTPHPTSHIHIHINVNSLADCIHLCIFELCTSLNESSITRTKHVVLFCFGSKSVSENSFKTETYIKLSNVYRQRYRVNNDAYTKKIKYSKKRFNCKKKKNLFLLCNRFN